MRPPRRALAAAAAVAVLGGACGGGGDDAGDAPASTTVVTQPGGPAPGPAEEGPGGFRPDAIQWDECGAMECASVSVPLDYDHPSGEMISLFVTRTSATGARRGALFVNPGGPGGSAAEFAALLPLVLPASVTEHYDVVGVEPRGLPGSAPLDCGVDYRAVYAVDPTVEGDADRAALLASAEDVASACADASAELLPHVGTRDVARDLDAVRAAMRDVQLSYYGGSYGTAVGQVYAELFPARVRHMVLDGIVELGPAGLELAAAQAAGFETALARFAADCQGPAACDNDDLLAAVDAVLAAAEAPGGIPAPDADRPAGPGEVRLGLAQALYSQRLWPALDEAVADAVGGDGSGLVALADEYLAVGSFDVYFAVNCIDLRWPRGDPGAFLAAAEAAAAASPRFGEAIVNDYVRCVDWPVPPEPLTPVTAPGTPPILVLSTTGDPATPHAAGVAVAERLENGVLVVNEGDGHGALTEGGSCITALVAAYLVDGYVPSDGTTCSG
jgi:pimeloyl-ACP methyl ester carboxylesterase